MIIDTSIKVGPAPLAYDSGTVSRLGRANIRDHTVSKDRFCRSRTDRAIYTPRAASLVCDARIGKGKCRGAFRLDACSCITSHAVVADVAAQLRWQGAADRPS
jgi:hypothetical protein